MQYCEVQGVRVPTFIYGTAWKEDDTARLTRLAINTGFRGIDTANQRRHYLETGVGEALSQVTDSGTVRREDLFLQTKFTYIHGQDHRLPYDKAAPVARQVEQSCASSLEHLGVEYLDSYVLHGPSVRHGLAADDWEAWEAMEGLHKAGKTRLLGISNVAIDQLEELYGKAAVKPAVVQNRCFASTLWDLEVREFCSGHGIRYEGFSLLTANPEVIQHRRIHEIARGVGVTPAQVVFRFCQQIRIIVVTGTTSAEHMKQDLDAYRVELGTDEVAEIEQLAASR